MAQQSPPFGTFPLAISGQLIPGAALRLHSGLRRHPIAVCDPTNVSTPPVTVYQHNQNTPLLQWTVNHNMGYRPNVRAYSIGGREMLAEVVHAHVNQCLVYFDSPTAGFAVCS